MPTRKSVRIIDERSGVLDFHEARSTFWKGTVQRTKPFWLEGIGRKDGKPFFPEEAGKIFMLAWTLSANQSPEESQAAQTGGKADTRKYQSPRPKVRRHLENELHGGLRCFTTATATQKTTLPRLRELQEAKRGLPLFLSPSVARGSVSTSKNAFFYFTKCTRWLSQESAHTNRENLFKCSHSP